MNWKKVIVNRFYYSANKLGFDTSIYSMIGMGVGCFAMIIALSVMNGFESIVYERIRGYDRDLNDPDALSTEYFSDISEIIFTNSFLLSALNSGNFSSKLDPSVCGVTPRFESKMDFSIAFTSDESQILTFKVMLSKLLIFDS